MLDLMRYDNAAAIHWNYFAKYEERNIQYIVV